MVNVSFPRCSPVALAHLLRERKQGCLYIGISQGTRPLYPRITSQERKKKSWRMIQKVRFMYYLVISGVTWSLNAVFQRRLNAFAPISLRSTCKIYQERFDYGAGFSLTVLFTLLSYATLSFLNRLYASACAGESGFGSSSKS